MTNVEKKPRKQSVEDALRAVRNPHISPDGNCARQAADTIDRSGEFERGYEETVETPNGELASVAYPEAIQIDTSQRNDGVKSVIIIPTFKNNE